MKRNLLKLLLVTVLACGGILIAQAPAQNINSHRHPNLAAAQRLAMEAYQKIVAAQQANEYDMNGHAQKAEQLLQQASQELKLAAETANQK